MDNLGRIFKSFRDARHISLTEATGGEFSKSMLSRFENGRSELSAQKLFTALENIHTDVKEFTLAAHEHQKNSEQQLIDTLQEQSDNPDFIEAFYLEKQALYQKSRKKEDMIEAIIVKGFLCALKDGVTASTEESNFLHNYLFSVDIWGLYELKLFAFCTTILSSKLYTQYTKEMVNRKDFLGLFESNRYTIHTIFINGFFLAIESRHFAEATFFENWIKAHFYKENEAYLRIVFKFAQGELLFLQGNKENGLKQMKQAVHILQLLDCQTSAEYYQNGIEKLLKEN